MRNSILKSGRITFLSLVLASSIFMSVKSAVESPMRFWGSTTTCGPSYSIEPGSCYQNCTTIYQAFWVVVSRHTDYAVPC